MAYFNDLLNTLGDNRLGSRLTDILPMMKKAESEVYVSGNAESIHIQRDPMRGRRGYYTRGWTPASKEEWRFRRPPYNPETDCADCKGRMIVPNEEVNKRRSHYMQHHFCPTCKGSGKKEPRGA